MRVTVLNEKLVAFRASDGRVGLVDERCPHRGASMFFGRNEAGDDKVGGLRCVYHGWKFDVEGRCVDMPSEPPSSNFRSKVGITAYPCVERGGLVWTYMGPPALKPAFPELEWTGVPASHRFLTRHLQECNWFQALEGGFDTSHLTFLHRGDTLGGVQQPLMTEYEVAPMDFGFVAGSARPMDDGSLQWVASVLLMPFHKLIGRTTPDAPIGAHVWVPVDDESCMLYSLEYHPDRPLSDQEMERSRNYRYIHAETLPGSDRCVMNKDNDYMIDRALQKSGKSFTGIPCFGLQDCGIQESMGPIVDRTLEHLGRSDTIIIQLRRLLLRTLKDLEAGKPPPGMDPASYRVRSARFVLPKGVEFAASAADRVKAVSAAALAR